MSKPTVLISCPFFLPNLGGVEIHLKLLTEYLESHSYQTTVFTLKPLATKIDNYLPHEKKKYLEIFRFWWFGYGWFDKTTPHPFLQFIYIVPGLLIRSIFYLMFNYRHFDVVHAHGFASGFITRVMTVFFPIKRKVISTHFLYRKMKPGGFLARSFCWVFSGFDSILLVNEASGKQLRDLGINVKNMRVFHHWLDPKKFFPKDQERCRNMLKLPKTRFTVLFIGRIIRMKGVFTLLKVASLLSDDILFVFVGDGPDADEFKNEAKKNNNVYIAGRQPHHKIVDFLGAADFLILPSLEKEAQPMVVMEALMCGRPVVTTNMGAAGEMINPEVGLIITPTPESIKKTILDFYNHPDKLKLLQKKAREYALLKYSPRNAKIITDSYQ